MTQTKHNDDALFDRLVDGELSTAERQALLASLDDRRDGWRQCALAFLEAQAWGHQLKQMIAAPDEPDDESKTVGTPPVAAASTQHAGRWLAIAAGLLIAFSLGWVTNPNQSLSELDPGLAANDPNSIDRQEMPGRDELPLGDSRDAVTLLVRDTSGNNQRLQVPLMEVEALDQQFAASLPDELRAQFRDRGFDVQRRRRFAPMFFEQNQQLVPMVVPVDDTYVVPVSRPVF